MLIEFDALCADRGIRYSLDSGTLIGAARHKGFIPWDDDIDLIVPRPDYERLLSHPEWVPAGYGMTAEAGAGATLPFMKFVSYSYRAEEPPTAGISYGYLWIDVFPVDSVPDNLDVAARLARKQHGLLMAAQRSYVNLEYVTSNKAKLLLKKLVRPIDRVLHPASRTYAMISHNAQSIPYGSTQNVANMVWVGALNGRWIPIGDFDNLTTLEFEGHGFSVIPHWHEYLTGLYGDYMLLPPEEQRATHDLKVWPVEG